MAYCPKTRCDDEVYNIMLHLKLGLDIPTIDPTCRSRGNPEQQSLAHVFNCKYGGHRTYRHNAIRDVIFEHARGGGAEVKPEVKTSSQMIPRRDRRTLVLRTSTTAKMQPLMS